MALQSIAAKTSGTAKQYKTKRRKFNDRFDVYAAYMNREITREEAAQLYLQFRLGSKKANERAVPTDN